jgi:heavy metal sensor kinase
MRRLPIRWRLTLWYAGLFATALAVFGGGLYLGLRARLNEAFDEQLTTQTELIASSIRIDDGTPVLPVDPATLDDDLFVRLLDRDGAIALESPDELGDVPLDPAAVAEAMRGDTSTTTVPVDGETLRVQTVPVQDGGGLAGVVQVGLSRDEVDDTLGEVLSLLLLAAPLVLAAAAGGGYLLAGRALEPVATVTRLAGRIGERELDARLDLDLPDDELGRLARTFDGMLARIEDAFARQRQFTGDAAHELRTPLSLMRSQVDLALARPRSADDYRAALHGLDGDLERLAGLVDALLTLARADAGRMEPDRAPLDLAATIGLVIEQYTPIAAERDISLVDASSPMTLVADEDLLIQVLVNLLDNALDHTPPGGTVTVGCRRDGDVARLWVADTGPGIPPEHRERVFDRFHRVDTGRARDRGGTGLGLAICKAIAEAHGGTIALAPQDGPGTRVELTLPAGA